MGKSCIANLVIMKPGTVLRGSMVNFISYSSSATLRSSIDVIRLIYENIDIITFITRILIFLYVKVAQTTPFSN